MHVVTRKHLLQAEELYPDAGKEIRAWYKIAVNARWKNFLDVRQAFADADAVDGYVIFNIRQNRFRLVTIIHYAREQGRPSNRRPHLHPIFSHAQAVRQPGELGQRGKAMSTILANPTEMIRQGAPHLIHSDEQLAAYTQALFDLTAKPEPTLHEQEAIALLTLLIDQYESQRSPIPDAEPADVLRFLLDHNSLTPTRPRARTRKRDHRLSHPLRKTPAHTRPDRPSQPALSSRAHRLLPPLLSRRS